MRLKKQMIATGSVAILCLLLLPNHAKAAALQANGGTPTTKNANEWITQIRQMQGAGGALGLTDKIDFDETKYDGTKSETCDLKSSNTNLDIHLQKNTEYGAMVLLSASSYGNPNQIADGETTTGNKTGVVMNINGERVAAGTTETAADYMRNASKRYWDNYGTDWYATGYQGNDAYLTKTPKIGDATEDEMENWHGDNENSWFCFLGHSSYAPGYLYLAGLRRGAEASIFSYSGHGGTMGWGDAYSNGYSHVETDAPTRAVVVVGSGI